MKIEENISLKNFNTFGIDVKAKYFCRIKNENELNDLLKDNIFKNYSYFVLGGGSNILFTKNFEGLVVKIENESIYKIDEDENSVIIKASAGVVWETLVQYTLDNNYGGIENLTLIPGTVGAAPIQNIGAYGQELRDTFHSLDGIEIDSHQKRTYLKSECNFGYRYSIFKQELKNKFIITSVTLKLNKNPEVNTSYGAIKSELERNGITIPSIKDVAEVIRGIRRSKLPDPSEIGNAGSFFKNPEVNNETFVKIKEKFPDVVSFPVDDRSLKIPAAWLIEKCGWKGKSFGNFGVHKNQALILVNFGGASGGEIYELSQKIKESVVKEFGITLQEEVNII